MVLKDRNGNVIREPAVCKWCRETYDASIHYSSVEPSECFLCNHWKEILERDKTDTTAVVIKGHHYYISDENPALRPRGFGGTKFVIQFNDGRLVTTTNLWHQGEISRYWLPKFPDNAVFVK